MMDPQELNLTRAFAGKLESEHREQRPDQQGNMKIRHTDLRKSFTLLVMLADEVEELRRLTPTEKQT